MKQISFFLLIISQFAFAQSKDANDVIKISDDLKLIKLNEHAYIHVSYLTVEPYGRVGCNGLLYIDNNEAIIADTPAEGKSTTELINWLEGKNIKLKGVIANHFHADCIAGLPQIHQKQVPSYGSKLTVKLAKEDKVVPPNHTFKKTLKLKVGNKMVLAKYFGEAHTKDNVAVWIPDDKIVFGGCMIKSLKSGKGNLADANVNEWSNTITKMKNTYKDAKIIIPGHGKHGDTALLDYTINMFADKESEK